MLKPVTLPALSLFALRCKPLHGVRLQHANGSVEQRACTIWYRPIWRMQLS